MNNGDNAFIELVLPTILDCKLPRDASLRDAEIICVGVLPKEASLRDAPLLKDFHQTVIVFSNYYLTYISCEA
jgi:hypothetical protein